MTTNITVRSATRDDYPSIRKLLGELDEQHVRLLPNVFQPFDDETLQRERIARFVDQDDAELFVAQCEDEIVGLATVRIFRSPAAPMFRDDQRACMDDLVVSSESRGKGIGQQLLDQVAQWTRAHELEFLDINVWDENKLGASFFQANGFRPRSHRMELKVDADSRHD